MRTAQFAEERLSKLGAEGEDAARFVQIVRQEADRCDSIVRNLLQFTRVSPGQTETIDVASLVQHALDLVRHQLEVHHVNITFAFTGALLVAAHADETVPVFTNILINAQRAIPEGGELTVIVAPGNSRGKALFLSPTRTQASRRPIYPASLIRSLQQSLLGRAQG